jgi:hypothetical protein
MGPSTADLEIIVRRFESVSASKAGFVVLDLHGERCFADEPAGQHWCNGRRPPQQGRKAPGVDFRPRMASEFDDGFGHNVGRISRMDGRDFMPGKVSRALLDRCVYSERQHRADLNAPRVGDFLSQAVR